MVASTCIWIKLKHTTTIFTNHRTIACHIHIDARMAHRPSAAITRDALCCHDFNFIEL